MNDPMTELRCRLARVRLLGFAATDPGVVLASAKVGGIKPPSNQAGRIDAVVRPLAAARVGGIKPPPD